MSKLKINLIMNFLFSLIMQLFYARTTSTIPIHNSNNTKNSSFQLVSSMDYWLNQYYLYIKTAVELECRNYLVKSDGKNWQCSFLLLSDQDSNDLSSSFYCLCNHNYLCEDNEDFFLDLPAYSYDNFNNNDNLEFDETNSMHDFGEVSIERINQLCQESINQLTVETTWNCSHVNKTRDEEYVDENNMTENINQAIFCLCNRPKSCQFDRIINFNSI